MWGKIENDIFADAVRRKELREEYGVDEFQPLEGRLSLRREALEYHLKICDKFYGNPNVFAIYQMVRQSYNKLIVEEAQKIIDTYNPDGTPKERNDSDDN